MTHLWRPCPDSRLWVLCMDGISRDAAEKGRAIMLAPLAAAPRSGSHGGDFS